MFDRLRSPRCPLALSALALLGACGIFGRGPSAAEQADARAARLLSDLVDAVAGNLEISGQWIAAASSATSVDRLSVHYRMRLCRAARNALGYRDPHVGLLDLWTLCLQTEHYLTEGDGAEIFGDHQPLAVESARQSLAQVAELAGGAFAREPAVAAQRDVTSFAQRYPMRGHFVRVGLLETDVADNGFSLLQTLTFDWINPLSGFGSDVTEGAEAVGAAMDRFTVAAEFLPRQLGWQLELFVYDLEGSEALKQVADGTTRVADGVDGFVALADRLPGRLRHELTAVLKGLAPTLESIRRTLGEVRATAEPVGKVGATWATAAQQVDAMAQQATAALAKFDDTFRLLTDDGDGGNGSASLTSAEHGRPFDVLDWDRTAHSIGQMSEELQHTLETFQRTLAAPELDQTLDRARRLADDAIVAATRWVLLGAMTLIVLGLLAVWCVRSISARGAERSVRDAA